MRLFMAMKMIRTELSILRFRLRKVLLNMTIRDVGIGIIDVEEARQPLFTTKPDLERSGMGFTIMENFMDEVEVSSQPGKGTEVTIKKAFIKEQNAVQLRRLAYGCGGQRTIKAKPT